LPVSRGWFVFGVKQLFGSSDRAILALSAIAVGIAAVHLMILMNAPHRAHL
jgi:hypothetical protein